MQTTNPTPTLSQLDDLDRKWPVDELVDLLRLTPCPKKAVKSYFPNELSIRELILSLVSDEQTPSSRNVLCPISGCKTRNIGRTVVLAIAERLTHLNLGEQCNAYWEVRNRKLQAARILVAPDGREKVLFAYRNISVKRLHWSKIKKQPVEFRGHDT